MKVSSSSVLLATLAISSSSTSLAAPTPNTGEQHNADASLASSPSVQRSLRPADMQESIARATEGAELDARGIPLLDSLVDVVGAVLCPILPPLCPKAHEKGAKQAVFEAAGASKASKEEAIVALQGAFDIIKDKLQNGTDDDDVATPPSSDDAASDGQRHHDDEDYDYDSPSGEDTSSWNRDDPSSSASASAETTPTPAARRQLPNAPGPAGEVENQVTPVASQVIAAAPTQLAAPLGNVNTPTIPAQAGAAKNAVVGAAPIPDAIGGVVQGGQQVAGASNANPLPLAQGALTNVPLAVAGGQVGIVGEVKEVADTVLNKVSDTLPRRALPMPKIMRRWGSRRIAPPSGAPSPNNAPQAASGVASKAPVSPAGVVSKAPVSPSGVASKAPVSPDQAASKAPVYPDQAASKAPVSPDQVITEAPVPPPAPAQAKAAPSNAFGTADNTANVPLDVVAGNGRHSAKFVFGKVPVVGGKVQDAPDTAAGKAETVHGKASSVGNGAANKVASA